MRSRTLSVVMFKETCHPRNCADVDACLMQPRNVKPAPACVAHRLRALRCACARAGHGAWARARQWLTMHILVIIMAMRTKTATLP